MPIKNGWEVLEYLKPLRINIPIILTFGSIYKNDIERGKKLGAYEFLSKPYSIEEFSKIPKIIEDYKKEHGIQDYEIALTFVQNKIRTIKLFKDGRYEIYTKPDKDEEERNDLFANLLQANEIVKEFEFLLNDPKTKEKNLHEFFEKNPDFILNDDYETAHSKVTLHQDLGNILVPDFVLEPYNKNAFCDLLELKLPNAKLFTIKKNRIRYTSAVFEACAQLREYAAYFENSYNRENISRKYNLRVYKPQMIVVIGRNFQIEPEIARRIQYDLPNLKVRTYDDILFRIKRKLFLKYR